MDATAFRADGSACRLVELRKERTDGIREQLKRRQSFRYIYLLLEPDDDVIRYVGCCSHPDDRYRHHVSKNAIPLVKCWVDSLKERGQLPRMEIVGTVGKYGFWHEQIVAMTEFGEVVELAVINKLLAGKWVGNVKMKSDLLNIRT